MGNGQALVAGASKRSGLSIYFRGLIKIDGSRSRNFYLVALIKYQKKVELKLEVSIAMAVRNTVDLH